MSLIYARLSLDDRLALRAIMEKALKDNRYTDHVSPVVTLIHVLEDLDVIVTTTDILQWLRAQGWTNGMIRSLDAQSEHVVFDMA